MPLEELVKEVQRKIGRNILLYQNLEYILKYLIKNKQISGSAIDIERRIAYINKQTLGQLVGQFTEYANPDREDGSSEPDDLDDCARVNITTSFHIHTDTSSYEAQKASLASLVSERNELVHHLLPELDLSSVESCRSTEKQLDKQAEKIREEIKSTESLAISVEEEIKKLANYFSSDKGKKQIMILCARSFPLVDLLAEISTDIARTDGWTLMAHAGQFVREHAPEELERVRNNKDYKNMRSLMVKSEMFDFQEEQTAKGGTRVLFRLKEGWEITREDNEREGR